MTQSNLIRTMVCTVALLAPATPSLGQALAQHHPQGHGWGQGVPVAPSSAARVQGFSVVLVLGSLKDSAETFAAGLPRGATRALADMTDFLPYRSYRLLDSAWILNPGAGRATTRMRGTDNRQYEVSIDASPSGASTLTVKFALRENGEAAPIDSGRRRADDLLLSEASDLSAMVAVLEAELADLTKRLNANHPDVHATRARLDEAKTRLQVVRARQNGLGVVGGGLRLIDTGFTIDVGETVVVGTSRLQGDTALIALLTAVPRGSK